MADFTKTYDIVDSPGSQTAKQAVLYNEANLDDLISDYNTKIGDIADVKDENDMASDSATSLVTQQSIKAYVDSGTITMTNKTFGDDTTFSEDIVMASGKLIGITGDLDLITLTSGVVTVAGNVVVADGGNIGSASDTDAIAISAAGEVVMNAQPSFCVNLSGTQENLVAGVTTTVQFDTERFDQNADFDVGTYTFTAPVTGKYLLAVFLDLRNIDSAASNYELEIVTSNKAYQTNQAFDKMSGDLAYWSLNMSVVADMDATDTCHVTITQTGGSNQTDVSGQSHFSGALIC